MLEESENLYKLLVEVSPDATIITNLKWKIIEASQQAFNLFGADTAKLIGKNFIDLIASVDQDEAMKNLEKILFKSYIRNIEYVLIRQDGSKFISEFNVNLILDGYKKPVAFIANIRDITKYKTSEEKYRYLFENSPYSIILLDMKGVIIDYNSTTEKMFGYKKGSFIGKNYLKLPIIPSKFILLLKEREKLLFKEVISKPIEFQIYNKDGRKIWVQSRSSLVKLNEANFIQITIQDIAERKKIEKKLVKSEDFYRTLFEHANNAIFLENEKEEIIDANQAASQLFGYTHSELLKKKTSDLTPPTEQSLLIYSEPKVFFNNPVDKVGIRRDGTQLSLEINIAPLKSKKKTFFLSIVRDITERKKMEEALRESEERYRMLIKHAPLGILSADIKGNIKITNPALLKILGSPSAEATKKLNLLTFPLLKKVGASTTIKHCIDKGELIIKKFVYKSKWGKEIICKLYASPNRDSFGQIIGVLCIIEDITERIRAEQELKESENKFRRIFEVIPDLFFLVSKDTCILEYRGKEEMLYLPPEKTINNKMLDILPEKEALLCSNAIKRTIETQQPNLIEYSLTIKGELRDFEARHLFLSKDRVAVFIREITERKKIEKLIKEEIKKLKELDKIRKELISGISHELKTPLMQIMGSSELFLSMYMTQLDSEALELIQIIERGGKRLNNLVENLLDVSRLQYDKFKLKKKMINLCKLVRECCNNLKFFLKKRNITLNLDILENLYLELDKIRIIQVVTNLLSNAIKNTSPKGNIKVILKKSENWVKLLICDTGIGLTKEEMKFIFTRFGKIERVGEGLEFIDIRGSGLGLFISRSIIDLHGGQIWAESEGRHKGSTFIVKLPYKQG